MHNVSVFRGAVAGLVAGLFASFMMDRFQAAVSALAPSDSDAEPATDKAASRLVRALTGHDLAASQKKLGGQLVHYSLGAGLGVVYGVTAEHWRQIAVGYGTAYGMAVTVVLDEAAVPAAGLGDPPWKTGAGTHVYSIASHLLFGVTAELVRGYLRPGPHRSGPTSGRRYSD